MFHVVGSDARGKVLFRKVLRRGQVRRYFANVPSCVVGMEGCASAHYWARELRGFGHEVRLIPAQHVKACVRGNKNDYNDARAIGGWRVDPARPAVIVGTVDIVSSRLPFSGYGDGRSRRSMHAGSLGHDTVVVVDEGHLSPAVGELLRASSRLQDCPEFRSMRLSAGSAATGPALRLLSQDRKRAGVRRRLFARKTARFEPIARGGDLVAAIRKAAAAHRTGVFAVFVRSVAHPRRTRPPLPCEPLSRGRDKPIGCVQRRLERGGRHGQRAGTARPVTRAGLERRRGGQSFRVFESQRLCNILITIGNTTR